ncbi:MAG: hypothetical protein HUU23_15855 [Caldilineales bacterium]|nr:hypothetical protein [Caldilineales bacterium]
MSRNPQSRGTCVFCGQELSKAGITRHLTTCAQRQTAIAAAASKPGRSVTLYQLQVLDRTPGYSPNDPNLFWLHLEIKGNATLEDLDYYLRAIWLECCGHLSAFEINDIAYTQLFDDGMVWREERSMAVRVDKLFHPGLDIPYEYDFGTTSNLLIRVLSQRQGKPLSVHPIYLMARNTFAPPTCVLCGQPAVCLCVECAWEGTGAAFCEEHAVEHEHDMIMGIFNSPRTGLCGYDGPAEPPY